MRYILVNKLAEEIEATPIPIQPAFNVGRYNKISGNYQILLATSTVLRKHHVDKIRAMGIRQVCIKDPLTDDIEIAEPIHDDLLLQYDKYLRILQKKVYPIYQEFHERFIDQRMFTSNYRAKIHSFMCQDLGPVRLTNALKEIYEDFVGKFRNQKIPLPVKPINSENFLVNNSIFAAMLATKLQMKLHASHENMWNVFVGTCLQDIGVAPDYFFRKEVTIEHERTYKEHPKLGLMIVNETPSWNPLMGIVVLNHHRFLNRSGFPRSLKVRNLYAYEKGIHIHGKIGSLVSAYSTLSFFYPEHLVRYAFTTVFNDFLFEGELTEQLPEILDTYPTGTALQLRSGEKGIVKRTEDPDSLLFRVIYDEKGKRLSKKTDIKLAVDSEKIKGPWYVDEKFKKRITHNIPEILTSFLEY